MYYCRLQDKVLFIKKLVVDRITIMKHLLSDETDPFNRSKLTKEMLVEQTELKNKIQDFI